jgi:hypothetical protein
MLVKIAFETNGIVEICETVLNSSNKYRKGQDHISAFISEKIIKTNNPKDKIKKTELSAEFKMWFEQTQGQGSRNKMPKGDELSEIMNKKFGQPKPTGWHGVKIIYQTEEDDVIDEL